MRIYRREQILQEIEATKNRLNDRMNNEDLELLKLLKQQVIEIEEASFLLDDSNFEPKGSKSAIVDRIESIITALLQYRKFFRECT